MKSLRFALFPWIIILCCFLSCNPAELPDNQDGTNNGEQEASVNESGLVLSEGIVLKPGVKYFKADAQPYIEVLDTNLVSISSGIPDALKVAEGDIILVDCSDAAPLGFMGKVASIRPDGEKFIVHTMAASLEEVFDELHIDTSIDAFANAESFIDDDGVAYAATTVSNSFWEEIETGGKNTNDAVSPKTKEGVSFLTIKRIPFNRGGFEGFIYLSSSVAVKIDIKKGHVQEYDLVMERQSYISGKMGLKIKGGATISVLPEVTLGLPVGIPVAPGIVLQPLICASLKAELEGEVNMGSYMYVGLEKSTTRLHDGEHTMTSENNGSFKLSPYYLDCEGSVEIIPRVAVKFDVWGLRMLGFGVDAQASLKFTLDGKMEMVDKMKMTKELMCDVERGGSVGAFLYGKLFDDKEIRISVAIPSESYTVDLFDVGKGIKVEKSVGSWSLNAAFDDDPFLSVDEKGFALFKSGEEEPVLLVSMNPNATTKGDDTPRSVSVPGNPLNYYLRPYNLIVSERDGKKYYFYGKKVGDYVKSILVRFGPEYRTTLSFKYDDYGRIISAGTYKYQYSENSVHIEGALKGFPFADTGGELYTWNLTLDNEGRLTSGSGSFAGVSYVFSSGFRSLRHPDYTSHYMNLSYDNGNLVHILEHGEDPVSDNVYIWNHNYSFSYDSRYNPANIVDIMNYSLFESDIFPPFLVLPEISNKRMLSGYTFTSNSGETEHYTTTYAFDEKGRISSFKTRSLSGTVTYYYDTEEWK